MSLFDIFSTKPAEQARDAQVAGLNQGYDQAKTLYGTGNQALTSNFGTAKDAFSNLQAGTQKGADAYADSTGANGPEGLARAKALFMASPGYQSGFDLLSDTNDRKAASRGMLGSGNTIADTAKLATTYSDQNYGNFVNRQQPFLGANAGAVAGGAAVDTGLGTALNTNAVSQGGLADQTQVGIGNANANADLAKYGASANLMKLFGGAAGLLGGFGTPGGGTGAVGYAPTPNGPGSVGPMFGGGPNQSGGGGGFDLSSLAKMAPMLMSLSDERVKDDIDRVGRLDDGQPVYRYRYKGDPVTRIGLMAQDVELTHPESVAEFGGIKAVDYKGATDDAVRWAKMLDAA